VLDASLPAVEHADAEFFAPVDREHLLDVLGRLGRQHRGADSM
jgi:hypothetical protein